MSIRIPVNQISDEQLRIIDRLLNIKPKPTFEPGKKNFYNKEEKLEPICLYQIEDGIISLPYAFARTLFKLPIPSYHPSVSFQFTKNLYEAQIQVVEDALNHLITLGSTTLNLATAFGKTVVSIYLAAQLKKLTLIFITGVNLGSQWYASFKEFSNAKVWHVGGQEPVPKDGLDVIICMNTRFKHLPKELVNQIGLVIYDEAHTFCTPGRTDCILGVQPQYVIAATATLNRPDAQHTIMESTCGLHKIIKISRKKFIVYRYNTGIDIEIKLNRQGSPDWSKITLQQAQSEKRNLLIEQLIQCNMNAKILVLTWRSKSHAIPLAQSLKMKGYNVDYMAGTKKTYHDSHILIGTIKKIGTGFDEKSACEDYNGTRINLLILVGSTKSVELLEQIAGRAFRSDFPQIIHFVDDCSISVNHWKKSVPWYVSRNGEIYEVNSPYYDPNVTIKGKIITRQRKQMQHDIDSTMDEQLTRFQQTNAQNAP